MYTTPHAKQRFMERVNYNGLPKKLKERDKVIEKYLKKAYNHGLLPNDIEDKYLRDYMFGKLKSTEHFSNITRITHYKNNLFLFHNRKCVTILDVPKRASESINNAIYIDRIKPFINSLNENKYVKKWLSEYGSYVENITDLKKCIIRYPKNIDYLYILNHIPLGVIPYIKNDSKLKRIVINANKERKENIKSVYYFICALLMLIPKNQIIKLQRVLKNNKQSVFAFMNNKEITNKQIDVCYKQLTILLGNRVVPKYKHFKVDDNLCYDIINDYFNSIFNHHLCEIKQLFKQDI